MIGRAFACALAFAIAAPHSAAIAQVAGGQSAVLTVDPERMFAETRLGRSLTSKLETAQQEFLAENKQLETALEAEEKELTDRRPSLSPAEFRKLADAFDLKAEEIRNARLAKSRNLATQRLEDSQNFLNAVKPVIGDLMVEMGALVILDQKSVFLSFKQVDVTDRAIARIDAILDDKLQPKPTPTSPPNPAPAP
jgi:Skp family chaperone for outer membrane proteins